MLLPFLPVCTHPHTLSFLTPSHTSCLLTSHTPHIPSHPHPLTPHPSHLTPPHTSHPLIPHTPHSTPLTEYIRGRHNHIYGPCTPPSSTTPRRQPRVGQHPKPREGHCRKHKEPRIYPQGKLNYCNLLTMTRCHWCSLLRPYYCLVPPPTLISETCILANVQPITSLVLTHLSELQLSNLHLSKTPQIMIFIDILLCIKWKMMYCFSYSNASVIRNPKPAYLCTVLRND